VGNDRVVIETTVLEYGLFREEHDALDAELNAAGFRVHRTQPDEYRSAPDAASWIVQAADSVKVLLDDAGYFLTVEEILRRTLRARGKRERTISMTARRSRASERIVIPAQEDEN
jgi:hypothetical protein